ncbi:MAG: RMD1 family protein [Silvanigrellaceae bacterium]
MFGYSIFRKKVSKPVLKESIHSSDMSLHQRAMFAGEVNAWLSKVCQERDSDLSLHAETYKEDFELEKLPETWGAYPSLDVNDVRAKLYPDAGIAFAWRFGAIVFVDVPKDVRHREVEHLREALGLSLQEPRVTAEKFFIFIDSSRSAQVEYNRLVLPTINQERLGAVVQTLAQSVAMEYYELVVTQAKQRVLSMLDSVRRKGRISTPAMKLNSQIADASMAQAEVVGVLHLLDKPDILWNDAEMESIYADLRNAFDLEERFKAIEYKIDTIKETLRIILEARNSAFAQRLEIVIILLVGIEVLFSLFERFHLFGW